MRPTTREVGQRVGNILEAFFDSPDSAFNRIPPQIVLAMTYHCSKVSEGVYTFALGMVERGDGVLVPAGQKLADLRVEAHGRVAIGFGSNARPVVEFGVASFVFDAVSEYDPVNDIQQMALDIMFHLCSGR